MTNKISKYFSLDEFTRSQTATRLGIDNTPSLTVIANLQNLANNLLDPLRAQVGIVQVSSGYRSPLLNSKIGGTKNSQHCMGQAADITVPGMSNYDLACLIRDRFSFDQCILEFGEWVHVSLVMIPSMNRKQSLTARKENGQTVYLPGILK